MKALKVLLAAVLVFALSVPAGFAFADEDRRDATRHYEESGFYGPIESMPEKGFEGIWTIGGRKVRVSSSTSIKEKRGRAVKGALAEVEGRHSGDVLIARKIEIKGKGRMGRSAYPAKFYGVIERMPEPGPHGRWTVNGREIVVNRDTRIREKYGRAAAGAFVEVEGNFSGKDFIVYKIEVKGDRRHGRPGVLRKKGLYKDMSRPVSDLERLFNSRFSGKIEGMPESGYEGSWTIGGRKVEVNRRTLIDETEGRAASGVRVKVKGIRKGDVIIAHEIEVAGK